MADPDWISISSGYGGTSRRPYVQLVWGAQVAQLSPDDARAHALRLLEVAEAAEQDAFLVEFAEKIGIPLPKAAGLLKEFREWRSRRGSSDPD